MNQDNSTPDHLFKIVSSDDWRESQVQNRIVTSPMDKDFIHLSTESQISHVVQKFWRNKNYMILKLDSKRLIGCLIYETNPGGSTQYYHLYEGEIPLSAVVEVSSNR